MFVSSLFATTLTHTAPSQIADLATAISTSSVVDNPELGLTVSAAPVTEGEIQPLDISSLTSLAPLSSNSTLESVLNEPIVAPSETAESKIDIMS